MGYFVYLDGRMCPVLSDNLTLEQIREVAMVDLAYQALQENDHQPMIYRDLMDHIAKLKGFTDDEVAQYISQFYTDLNIDGRFVCVGRSLWGLRDWYLTEQTTDSAIASSILTDDEEFEDEVFEDESEDFDHDLQNIDADDEEIFEDDSDDDEDFPEALEDEELDSEEEEDDL